jgi:cell division protein FtsB
MSAATLSDSGLQATSGPPVTPPPPGPERGRVLSPAQLTILVVACVSVYFVTGFYGKSLDSYRINQRAVEARQENARLEAHIKDAREKVAYLATDSYLETAAREKLNLVKPGDRPVVVLPAQAEVAGVAGPPLPSELPRPFAELGHFGDWLRVFFGAR